MKMIGLVGGISWVSSLEYYRVLNQLVNQRLGGLSSARCILYSLDFAEIKALNDREDWATTLELVTEAARRLVAAGADCIMLGANTMHLIADDLRERIEVPLIHIAEATAAVIQQEDHSTVGLLGTRFTMEMDFFKDKLAERGIRTLIPPPLDREFVHETIFGELGKGIFAEPTRERYRKIVTALVAQGAEGIVLGCTEIPLLLQPGDCAVPLFDTVKIHAAAAVDFALAGVPSEP